jgi:hypothetical protein
MEQPEKMEEFTYTLDGRHSYHVGSQEDLFSTIFQIEYTKQTQTEAVLACSKECFQAWRQEDLAKPERDCLQSCFQRSNQLFDLFYQGSVALNSQFQNGLQRTRRAPPTARTPGGAPTQ